MTDNAATSRVEIMARVATLHQNATRQVWLFGNVSEVNYQVGVQVPTFSFKQSTLVVGIPKPPLNHQAILRNVLIQIARRYLTSRLQEIAEFCQLSYNTARIKEHRSKWGSCSSKKNINLNWRLILLPKSVIDYVLVHELMHLREMNHSARFWEWVKNYLPNYKQEENLLKQLTWVLLLYPPPRR